MQINEQKKIFEEIKGFYANNSSELADSEMHFPAMVYYDPAHLVREKRVLEKYPVVVGHAQQLMEPGDFLTHDLLGIPILVVRQKDRSLKAFLNICSHRGARICNQESGNAKLFVCPYHAWTYSLDGQLRGVPKSGFPNYDIAEGNLATLQVEERHGLVWVQVDPATRIDVAAHLGEIDDEIASYGITDCEAHLIKVVDADINWKSVLDGFLEPYHFATLHAESIAPYFHGDYSPFRGYGLNGRMIGVRKSFDAIIKNRFEDIDFLQHVAVNYQIFPNTVLVWQGDHFECWTAYPGNTPDKCRVLIQMLIPSTSYKEEKMARWERNWTIIKETVFDEDWAMSHQVQQNLRYKPKEMVVFGANEPALQYFHKNMKNLVDEMN
tara:strand:- start:2035 stop:3177 length:1143 start_codon:yes stop_codon:yes gene_type:complete